jgi:hypothetical protein
MPRSSLRLNWLLLASLLLLVPGAPAAAMDQQKHDDIAALMRLTGAADNMRRVIDLVFPQIMGSMKQLKPELPAALWEFLQREAQDEFERSVGELEEPTIAIYDSAFSGDEIKELLAFYESPLGRKVLVSLPNIQKQSLALGTVWGRQVGARVVARLRAKAKEKGYDL